MSKARDLLGKTGSPGIKTEQKKSIVDVVHDSDLKKEKHPEFKPPTDANPSKGNSHAAGGTSGASSVRPKV